MGTSLTATGVQFPDNSVQVAPAMTGFRNRIINGNMKISQRGTSFPTAAGYTIDRFTLSKSSTSAITITQNADVPTDSNLSNSLRASVTTADTSIAAAEYSILLHIIEGYNVADLVNTPFTISFWVRSSKTGIHCVSLRNSAADRTYVSEYSISTANTWEKKSITINDGLTTGGNWNFTNGRGLEVGWSMACGSSLHTTANSWIASEALTTVNQVNCLDTVGNIFAITGVQLEKGSVATDFEHRSYGLELALCQRYYYKNTFSAVTGYNTASGNIYSDIFHPVQMRISPTLSLSNYSNVNCGNAAVIVTNVIYFRVSASIVSTGGGYSTFNFDAVSEL